MEFLFASDYFFIIFNQMVTFYQNILSGGIDRALIVLGVGAFIVFEIDKVALRTKIKERRVVAMTAKWVFMIITILIALEEAHIGNNTIQTFSSGFALMIALSGGLAFGLGGQYQAKEILEEFKHKIIQK
ncbi:MAG: hypothetical protein WC788_03165 [Candidatus Paceibacterota bacterium]|jgi:hypothetical protein